MVLSYIMEIGEKIRTQREALGLSQADLAHAVGVSQATVDKIESGKTLRSRYLPRIAARLGIPLTELDPDLESHAFAPAEYAEIGTLRPLEPELPVYAAPNAHPIDRVRRPAPLANVRGAYGLLVDDEAMQPEFWPGDVALINPHLPPVPGATYVLRGIDEAGRRQQLRYLTGIDKEAWHVRQWNPPEGTDAEAKLSRKDWPVAHRVIGKYSR
jgi:transcriptional regulator with XRE-family HTH domain